jgi:hypothetical protein
MFKSQMLLHPHVCFFAGEKSPLWWVNPQFVRPQFLSGRRVAGHCRHGRRINHGGSCRVLGGRRLGGVLGFDADGVWTLHRASFWRTWQWKNDPFVDDVLKCAFGGVRENKLILFLLLPQISKKRVLKWVRCVEHDGNIIWTHIIYMIHGIFDWNWRAGFVWFLVDLQELEFAAGLPHCPQACPTDQHWSTTSATWSPWSILFLNLTQN